MGRGIEKRRRIFKIYASHLNFLKANGFLLNTVLQYEETYICPVCLRQFCEADLEDSAPNMLTIEHAPPDASGGKGTVLTCKECNSTAGIEIDYHLVERLQEVDRRQLLPNTTAKVKVTSGELTIQGNIEVEADGIMKMRHSLKNNHPVRLNTFVDKVGPTTNPLIHMDFGESRTDTHRVQVGLLKSAYILAFAEFGYSFLLDGVYNVVRQQILNPDKVIYPEGFWHQDHELFKQHEGIFFCLTPIVEGIHCVFPIKTAGKTRHFGVHLPIPMTSPEVVIGLLKDLGPGSKIGNALELKPVVEQDNYLFDVNTINRAKNWFLAVRMSKMRLDDTQNIAKALTYLRHPVQKEAVPLRFAYPENLHIFAP